MRGSQWGTKGGQRACRKADACDRCGMNETSIKQLGAERQMPSQNFTWEEAAETVRRRVREVLVQMSD